MRKESAPSGGFWTLSTGFTSWIPGLNHGALSGSFWTIGKQETPKPVTDIPKRCPTTQRWPSHKGYLYYQPNPLNNCIGDCVIRAYSAVFNLSWADTLDLLARSSEYNNTVLNSRTNYRFAASEYEADTESWLKDIGKGLTVSEFCDRMTILCHNGERFFADAGSYHVVGIIPIVSDWKTHYVAADSWDCSQRRIGVYWVYRPVGKKVKQKAAGTKPLSLLSVGTELVHPAFGSGIIQEIDDRESRVTYVFRSRKPSISRYSGSIRISTGIIMVLIIMI